MFRDTRVRGFPIPCHRTFEEVNLRFYVRRVVDGDTRRAVVFLREIVPRFAVAEVARRMYNEPYIHFPMSHASSLDPELGGATEYEWGKGSERYSIAGSATGAATESEVGSEAEFVTEHYWGYTRQRDGGTLEYRVDHARWKVWEAEAVRLDGDFGGLYGAGFGRVLTTPPRSAFIAVGGPIAVHSGLKLSTV